MSNERQASGLPLRIFISHKMPSDTALAADVGSKLALYGGNQIEVRHAGMFRYGDNWRRNIQDALSEADVLLYLFTDQDEDWGFCLFECGFFRATMDANPNRKLITLTRNPEQISDALKEFNAAPVTDGAVYKLLDQIYRENPWNISPNLKDETLMSTASSIVELFTGSERVEANFDVAPSVVVEIAMISSTFADLKTGKMPSGSLISGIKEWQKLFDRDIDTGAWLWSDLTDSWEHKDVYEFLIARMMHDAVNNHIPKGVMLRSLDSNEVYRLTLRRYERLRSSKYKFYFTASLLDVPFSISVQRAREKHVVLYHLVAMSWYFRRRVVDELYRKVLEAQAIARQKLVNVGALYDDIASELMDIDSQSIIRGVDNRLVVEEALGQEAHVTNMLNKLDDWYTMRSKMFQIMSTGAKGLSEVAETLSVMAVINFEFYRTAARAYARAAEELELPRPAGAK